MGKHARVSQEDLGYFVVQQPNAPAEPEHKGERHGKHGSHGHSSRKHGKSSRRSRKKKAKRTLLIVLAVVLAVVLGVGAAVAHWLTGLEDSMAIPRDTKVTLEGVGEAKINAAYNQGGPAGMVDAVSQFAGVPISHYAEIRFEEFKDVVDMLGGVTVNNPEAFTTPCGQYFAEGEIAPYGEDAWRFIHERKGIEGGDFHRTEM